MTQAVLLIGGLAALLAALVAVRRGRTAAATASDATVAAAAAESRARVAHAASARLAAAVRELSDTVIVVDVEGEVVASSAVAGWVDDPRHGDALAAAAIGELLAEARAGGEVSREVELVGPPARSMHIEAHPLVAGGALVGAVAMSRDVSETRRVEHVRRDFVANVSHELKTPIGALALLAETIAAGGEPEVVQHLAERIAREAERLGRIVDDLLDLSVIESQESDVRERCRVEDLVATAVEHVEPTAAARGIALVLAGPLPEVTVACDPRQVRSALVNLLENAVKYTEHDTPVEVGIISEGDRVGFVVRDRGIGIPARDLERIFERFYRVDRARSRESGGTGLGLSIVRHVAQAHGGEVTVASREGEGSTFTLWLPRSTDVPAPEGS